MEFSVSVTEMPQYLVVVIEGSLDLATVPLLERETGSVRESRKDVVTVLDHLDFIDSAGIGFFINAYIKRYEKGTRRWAFVSKNENIVKIFRMTGMERFAPIFPDFKQATDFLSEGEK